MKIRAMTPADLSPFVEMTESPDEAAMLSLTLNALFAEEKSRPEWLLVAEDHARSAGRVGFFDVVPASGEAKIMALQLDWEGDYLGVGLPLLMAGFNQLRQDGMQRLERRVFSFWDDAPQQRELFAWVGMGLTQQKLAYSWQLDEQPDFEMGKSLTYRRFRDIGVEAFIDIVAQTLAGSLDRFHQRDLQQAGPEQAALDLVEQLLSLKHNHNWWQVGYDRTDELVGLVTPLLLAPAEGSIGYVGVVPEQRKKGFGQELLNYGGQLLQEAGIAEIYCDCDSQNEPMQAIFEHSPFQPAPDGQVWIYEKVLQ